MAAQRRVLAMILRGAPVALLFALGAGCKDEPKKEILPPNKPSIDGGKAVCEKIEERFLLRSVAFAVTDLDGVADLKKVEARVERYADVQPLSIETIPLTKMMVEVDMLEAPVRNEYAWERSPNGPDFFCGDAGDSLDIFIRAEDTLGYGEEILISPTAL